MYLLHYWVTLEDQGNTALMVFPKLGLPKFENKNKGPFKAQSH